MPENSRFGGGASGTILHPVVALAMIVTIACIFCLPRKRVIGPFLAMLLLAPVGQEFVLGGVHLFVSRIVILAGCIQMLMAKKTSKSRFAGGMNKIDKAVAICAISHAIAFTLLYADGSAVVNQVGYVWDMLGGYFFLRYLIQDRADIGVAVKALACVAGVVAICMVYEQYRQINLFGYLGGFRMTPEMRDGRVRSQGPFAHSLLAGAFGGTLLPLFLWLWNDKKSRLVSVLGVVSSLVISWASACSTPIMAMAAGVGALFLWPIRGKMRLIRWGIVCFLAIAALVMKAPVWFLIAHIDLTGSSSGYHRAMLVDVFIRHFLDWFLLGVKDASVWGFDMWDTCNQYVQEGELGGLVAFSFFILTLSRSFSRIGITRKAVAGNRKQEWLLWVLGATLFSHTMGFLGISYFDQTKFYWYAFLAMVSAATVSLGKTAAEPDTGHEDVPAQAPASAYFELANKRIESVTSNA